jgi:hypothetical protein
MEQRFNLQKTSFPIWKVYHVIGPLPFVFPLSESQIWGEVAELMLEQAVASVRVLGCWEDFLLPAGG